MTQPVELLAVGDIILGPDGDRLMEQARPLLKKADVAIGQLEVTYTEKDEHAVSLGRIPQNLMPLARAGLDAVTLAGNHVADYGREGLEDTMRWLSQHGIGFVGAGMNLDEARKPLILERKGTRIGVLNYNCVGPAETWAGTERPGNAYIRVITHYELDHANPGGPPKAYTWAEPVTMGMMEEDIRMLRPRCDVLIVALHKGLVHTPVKLLEYEYQVSHAAVDWGADLVLSHHAHILKAVEWYKGKAIFHGLGNGFVYLPAQALVSGNVPEDWAGRRKTLFGFEPDPDYPTYPFHPEAKYTMIAKCVIERQAIARVAFLPAYICPEGRMELPGRTEKGKEMLAYMRRITSAAGLSTRYEWSGDEVEVVGDDVSSYSS